MDLNRSHLAALLLDYSDAPSADVAARHLAGIRERMFRRAYRHEFVGLCLRGHEGVDGMAPQLTHYAAQIGAARRAVGGAS